MYPTIKLFFNLSSIPTNNFFTIHCKNAHNSSHQQQEEDTEQKIEVIYIDTHLRFAVAKFLQNDEVMLLISQNEVNPIQYHKKIYPITLELSSICCVPELLEDQLYWSYYKATNIAGAMKMWDILTF